MGSLGPNICEDHSFAQKLGSPAQVVDDFKEELLIWYFLSHFPSSLAGRWVVCDIRHWSKMNGLNLIYIRTTAVQPTGTPAPTPEGEATHGGS